MPAFSRPVPVRVEDDVWHQHEAEIKDLYQNQRKNLKEVKCLMEQSGFPKTPLSTWESKLREILRLRKKVKADTWPLIYQHMLPRLKRPKGKHLKKKTIICLNNSEIPWDKVWKEIRRSGALSIDFPPGSLSPLPSGITIQTPPPSPPRPPKLQRAAQPVGWKSPTRSNPTTALTAPSMPTSMIAPTRQTATEFSIKPSLVDSFSVYLLQGCAISIPWLDWYQSMQNTFLGPEHSRHLEMLFSSALQQFLATSTIARAAQSQIRNVSGLSESRLDLLPQGRPIPPRPSPDLGYRVAMSGGQTQLGHFIPMAIFLLSNRLHDEEDCDQGVELLCSLFDRDATLTATLLRIPVPSVRAAWESLIDFSIRKSRKNMFGLLIEFGIHNQWLQSSRAGKCLLFAMEMDCDDIAMKIVMYFPNSGCSSWWRLRVIMAACIKGNVELASLLVPQGNVKANTQCIREFQWMFTDLIFMSTDDSSTTGYSLAMDLFLSHGANVDEYFDHFPFWNQTYDAKRLTILDHVFYYKRSLFDKLAHYSTVPASRIARTRLLVALEHGRLVHCLSTLKSSAPPSDWQHVQSLLELLLFEQFDRSERVDLRIVRGLFEYGVDPNLPSIEDDIRPILNGYHFHPCRPYGARLQFAWHQFSDTHRRMELLDVLLMRGGIIGERILDEAVAQYGIHGLDCLTTHPTEFATKAVRALARAASSDNFEAVRCLFHKGVDPHAFVTMGSNSYSIQALATGALHEGPIRGCSLKMIQVLASYGARLVVTPKDSTPFEFVNHLLRSDTGVTLDKIKYVLGKVKEGRTSLTLPAGLLDSCFAGRWAQGFGAKEQKLERLEIYEYLYRQGAEVSPGAHLAAFVNAGGREELVQDVLLSGAGLNAFFRDIGMDYTPLQAATRCGNETLVRLFLQQGANVNSPALGFGGYTALQGICSWSPATEEEHQRKIRICRLLIDQGADVNAAPSISGSSALGGAARTGDLELAALLLREVADINAQSRSCDNETALDDAALYGRLDTVKFLLNANALSGDRGVSGYDGAISIAERRDNSAAADLIREHAAKVKAGTVFNPEL